MISEERTDAQPHEDQHASGTVQGFTRNVQLLVFSKSLPVDFWSVILAVSLNVVRQKRVVDNQDVVRHLREDHNAEVEYLSSHKQSLHLLVSSPSEHSLHDQEHHPQRVKEVQSNVNELSVSRPVFELQPTAHSVFTLDLSKQQLVKSDYHN